ncbi:MAG: LuxR C-terminal-related transcriptional regulator [Hyphomicrobiales bacterium]|nr:LuxR C-terminal-related transcriptional regulator [Hyphomicrobiales bacterium]
MDQGVDGGLYAEAARFSSVGESDQTLDRFEARLRRLGATHLFVSALPMPRRSMAKLVIRIDWPDLRDGGRLLDVSPQDAMLACCLAYGRTFVVRAGRPSADCVYESGHGHAHPGLGASELLAAAGGERAVVIAVPVLDFSPWQGCVVVAGEDLPRGPAALDEFQYFCKAAMRRLLVVGRVDQGRPGDLSERERDVLRLTAIGKTAAEIADLLAISQRTVHAHLQNAGDKMNASNKTHTVYEAVRHGQIRL